MDLNCNLSTDIYNGIDIYNISNNLEYSIDTWIWYTCPPCILAFGTFGNIMILMVYRRLRITSTTMLMRALAITDLFFLYSAVFTEWLESFDIHFDTLHDVTCKLCFFSFYALGDLSAWLTASLTVQRAVSVVWPHRVLIMCTRTKTLYLVLGLICCVIVLNAHILYGFGLVGTTDNGYYSCDSLTCEYDFFFIVIWPLVDLLFVSLLPFVLLVISNCVLVWKMRTSMKGMSLVSGQPTPCVHREKRNSAVTRTLITMSVVFLILTLPITVVIYMDNRYFINTKDTELRDSLDLIYTVTCMLWYTNSAVNFYIYCVTGTLFRAEVKRHLCRCTHQSAQTQTTHLSHSVIAVQESSTRF